jgi:hypothetical protein
MGASIPGAVREMRSSPSPRSRTSKSSDPTLRSPRPKAHGGSESTPSPSRPRHLGRQEHRARGDRCACGAEWSDPGRGDLRQPPAARWHPASVAIHRSNGHDLRWARPLLHRLGNEHPSGSERVSRPGTSQFARRASSPLRRHQCTPRARSRSPRRARSPPASHRNNRDLERSGYAGVAAGDFVPPSLPISRRPNARRRWPGCLRPSGLPRR